MRCRWPPENSLRVAVVVLGVEADHLEQLLDPRQHLASSGTILWTAQRRADDRADGVPRVQRGVRVLEDHLDRRGAAASARRVRQLRDVLALELIEPDGRLVAAG